MTRKNLDLNFNINGNKLNNKQDANFYTDDIGISTIRIQLMHGNKKINLNETDMIPILDIKASDNTEWKNLELIDVVPEFGLIQCNLPSELISHGGSFKGTVRLEGDFQSVHISDFVFNIKQS